MVLLALATVPLVLAPEVFELGDQATRFILVVDLLVWLAFAVDLSARTWMTEHRVKFLVDHPLEVLIVVLPILRPLRLLRAARIFAPLVASGIVAQAFRKRSASWALVAAAIAIAVSALIVGVVERDSGGGIDDWGTVIWWGLATVTTVGYGDVVPVTTLGRIVGALLMLVGIGVFGLLTASVAAWFVEQDQEKEQETILEKLDSLTSEVKMLRGELQELQDRSDRLR